MNTLLTHKSLQELNCYCSSIDIPFIENKKLNSLDLKSVSDQVYIVDAKYYLNILISLKGFLDFNSSTKCRTSNVLCYLSLCKHKHEHSPQIPYLGVRYDLFDNNGKIFFRAKLSPYYSLANNRYEINMGIVLKNSRDIFTMSTYTKYARTIQDIHYTNLSPSHIYIHALDNKFFTAGLDTTHAGYSNDIQSLHLYAKQINSIYNDLDLSFNTKGIISYNSNYKIKDIYDSTKKTIPYIPTSSYIINHYD